MMDPDGIVAVTALVVGLVALLIAVGQLLQQIFGTADGYRRCQDSIVGPWAKRTRLVWRWSQFRFETKFTTPELVLYEEGAPIRKAVDLTGDKLPAELRETVSLNSENVEWSSDTVTWTLFIRQLYKFQRTAQSSPSEKTFEPPDTSVYAKKLDDSVPSKIGIIYRERTWDLMPTDAIRPMASTRLGAMVVLAHKLGMTWESTQTSEGYMRADGNGHSLVSSMVRGLGIVFSYSSSLHTYDMPLSEVDGLQSLEMNPFINSTASEKMLCGIIPGCRALSTPDILFMGKRPSESSVLIYSGLTKCGVPNRTAERLSHRDVLDSFAIGEGWSLPEAFPVNDLVALISPFMPTQDSTITRIMWPIRTVGAISAFHFWECRRALLNGLRKCSRTGEGHLKQVLSYFEQLEIQFNDDFYCRRNRCIIRSENPADNEKKRNMIKVLRSIHDWTTQYFQRQNKVLPYLDLVGAHVSLAHHCARESKSSRSEKDDGTNLEPYWAATAMLYIQNIHTHLLGALMERMQDGDDHPPHMKLVEESWWTLVLRGTVWYMSVHVQYPEYMLPSKLYYDQTPVFIM